MGRLRSAPPNRYVNDHKPTLLRVRLGAARSRGTRGSHRDLLFRPWRYRDAFTSYLLRALTGEADSNTDGFVATSELGAYLRPIVWEKLGNRQMPRWAPSRAQALSSSMYRRDAPFACSARDHHCPLQSFTLSVVSVSRVSGERGRK